MICELWGGQVRKHPDRWEWGHDLHGLEGAAVRAIQNPGQDFSYRDIRYRVTGDILFAYLPSGRRLTYHSPRLYPITCRRSKLQVFSISYMGWNSEAKKGPKGWARMDTYGGKLTEKRHAGRGPRHTRLRYEKFGRSRVHYTATRSRRDCRHG